MFWRVVATTRARASVLFAGSVLVAGCGSGSPATPTAQPTSSPGAVEFTLDVAPATVIGRAIEGEPVVILVTASGNPSAGDVTITADAPGATVSIDPVALPPGMVGEVTVVPDEISLEEGTINVTVAGSRSGIEQRQIRTIAVSPGEDTLASEADILLGRFTEWLAAERPDLGIGPETRWEGSPGGWVLVVNHYQYVSDEWELGLDWHVMIAPDDWARIYLRHRWTEAAPSAAFEIPSVSEGLPPQEIDPPESVWR
jgi:hypothetical protein